ncbi:MAG: hypothetical protein JW947_00085 [Sedimentisphaerales bacterium]|nr:hypothetical protein [Sedimentisphaerales bacterium]
MAQFLSIGWAGALVVTLQAWLLWLCTGAIIRLAAGRKILWINFIGPILLLIIYARYTYPFIYERYVYPFDIAMDLLAALGPACLYIINASKNRVVNLVIFAILTSVVYVVSGGTYLLFVVICGFYEMFFRHRVVIAVILLTAPLSVAYVVSKLFIDVGDIDTFNGFMPQFFGGDILNLAVVYTIYLLLPLALGILGFVKLLHKNRKGVCATGAKPPVANKTAQQGALGQLQERLAIKSADTITNLCVIILGFLTVCFCHNTNIQTTISVNYYASRGLWNKVLEIAGPLQHNKFVNHHINLALYHTGRLGDDMFEYDQVKGALMLSDESINSRGQWWLFDTYLNLGHINLAESMLVLAMETFGERPLILKRLALINMVKGSIGAAKIYLKTLGRTLFDAGWAKNYLDKIERDPKLSTDKEIQRLRGMMPEKDRDFESLDDNLFLDLLDRNKNNRMAFEYLTAYYLLTGQIDKFAAVIGRINDFDYKAIPRSYEEAILLYNFIAGKKIELPGLEISRETMEQFKNFNNILLLKYGRNKRLALDELNEKFGDSYFFYYAYGRTGTKK